MVRCIGFNIKLRYATSSCNSKIEMSGFSKVEMSGLTIARPKISERKVL